MSESFQKCKKCGNYYTSIAKLINHIAETGHKQNIVKPKTGED